MTVGELKKTLENLPDDMPVILQRDPEGNGYSPLYQADPECIGQIEKWQVENVTSLDAGVEDVCMTEDEWMEAKRTWTRIIVLVPAS